MQLLNVKGTIGFMAKRKIAMIFSAILMISSLGIFFGKGLELGLDFTGGTSVEVGFSQPADLKKIRVVLSENGFPDASLQLFGSSTDVLIRLAPRGKDVKAEVIGNQLMDAMKLFDENAQMRRIEFVGPSVGEDLKEQGGLAMLLSLIHI